MERKGFSWPTWLWLVLQVLPRSSTFSTFDISHSPVHQTFEAGNEERTLHSKVQRPALILLKNGSCNRVLILENIENIWEYRRKSMMKLQTTVCSVWAILLIVFKRWEGEGSRVYGNGKFWINVNEKRPHPQVYGIVQYLSWFRDKAFHQGQSHVQQNIYVINTLPPPC